MVSTRRGARTGADVGSAASQSTQASQRPSSPHQAASLQQKRQRKTKSSPATATSPSQSSNHRRTASKAFASNAGSHEDPLNETPIVRSLRSRAVAVPISTHESAPQVTGTGIRRARQPASQAEDEQQDLVDRPTNVRIAKRRPRADSSRPVGQTSAAVRSTRRTAGHRLGAPEAVEHGEARDRTPTSVEEQESVPTGRGAQTLLPRTDAKHVKASETESIKRDDLPIDRSPPAAGPSTRTTRARAHSKVLAEEQLPRTATRPNPKQSRKVTQARVQTPDHDLSMSSRSTTPSLSPAPIFVQPKDLSEDRADSKELEMAEDNDSGMNDEVSIPAIEPQEESEDELAGPKTPMRRSRRRFSTHANVQLGKPVRHKKGSASRSAIVNPVFDEQNGEHLTDVDVDTAARTTQVGEIKAMSRGEDMVNATADEDTFGDLTFADDTMFPDDADESSAPISALAIDSTTQPSDGDDPEETIVIDVIDEHDTIGAVADHSGELLADEEAAKRTLEVESQRGSDGVESDDDDPEGDYTQLSVNPKTPKPQTINWYHVEPNTALRDTLDLGLSPNVDHSQLGILPDLISATPSKELPVADEAAAEGDARNETEETVDFTEFVTMAGNQSTPIQATTADASESLHQIAARNAASLDALSDQAAHSVEDPSSQHPESTRDEQQGDHDLRKQNQTDVAETVPHYMLPTYSFDARRRTLPAKPLHSPLRQAARPITSDGARVWSVAQSAQDTWWYRPVSTIRGRVTATTPTRSRTSLAPFSVKAQPSRHQTPTTKARFTQPGSAPHMAPVYARSLLASPARAAIGQQPPSWPYESRLPRSPRRTPLRSITGATAVVSMAPHPAIPLRGVVAVVEVYTSEGASASAPFVALLHRLGAKTTKIWTDRVSHVIFKDGSPKTLQRIAVHNKRIARGGIGIQIQCVNSRWVSDCDAQSTRVAEDDEAYAVSTEVLTGSAKRKRRSMEPTTVLNIDGELVRDRRSSLGRDSGSRYLSSNSPSRTASPLPLAAGSLQRQVAGTVRDHLASPATPMWIAAPNRLVQATAPVKRIRRLALTDHVSLSSRRLTDSKS